MKGKVTDKKQVDGRNEVHLDVWVENQWGAVVSPGNAVVLLPTREAQVELPRPAQENIDDMYQHLVERYARENQ
jgi:hypothetical protein